MTEEQPTCFLCKTNCKCSYDSNVRLMRMECPACGKYFIDDGLIDIEKLDQPSDFPKRLKLAAVLAERKLKGHGQIFIHWEKIETDLQCPTMTVDELLDLYPKKPTTLLDRALLNLGRMVEHPTEFTKKNALFTSFHQLFCNSRNGVITMLKEFQEEGYITSDITSSTVAFRVKGQGWKKIEELEKTYSDSEPKAFVAMWFDPSMKEIWENGIQAGIEAEEEIGKLFKAVRIDDKEHNNDICDEIIAEIRQSRFVVADFTGDRGGVYYEAGFAAGLGIPVIYTVHKPWLEEEDENGKRINKLHFDTEHMNHIIYDDANDLKKKLINRIRATIPMA